jgi:hypothetical protein
MSSAPPDISFTRQTFTTARPSPTSMRASATPEKPVSARSSSAVDSPPKSPPPPDKRIYSIDFVHDGTHWTATVGEILKGTSTRLRTRGGRRVEVTTPVSDPATVLAIFAGNPYMVATTGGIAVRSAWVNPFMAGIPTRMVYFAAP